MNKRKVISNRDTHNNKIIKEKKNSNFFGLKLNKIIILISSLILVSILATVVIVINANRGKEKNCSVQFNTNGGLEIESISLNCGGIIKEPETPDKNGFDFLGWYFNGNKYDFSSKVDNNIVLEAKWEVKENVEIVIISFDTDGGSKQDDIEIEKGTYLVNPINPTKKGYTFAGWYLDNEEFLFISTPINQNITLKAKWNKVKETDKNDNQHNTGESNSSSDVITGVNNNENNIDVFHKYDALVNSYSGEWYLSGYEDVYCVIERKEYYDTAYMSFTCVNIDLTSKKVKYIEINSFDIKFNEWDKDLNKNMVKLNASSITIKDLKFVRNKGDKNRYDGTYYKKSLGTWYKYNNPESQLIIRSYNSGYTGIQESINYDNVCVKKIFIMGSTYEECDSVKNNKIYNDMGITIDKDILYMNINGEKVKFYKTATVINVSSIELSKNSLNLNVGDSTIITAAINPSDAYNKGVTWSSSNTSVATVDSNGEITAIGPGVTTIMVTTQDGNKTASCVVNVKSINITSISLNKTTLSLVSGNSDSLVATISPSNATNKTITWSSSDTSVATVNSSGKVTAVKKGIATITATTSDGGYAAECIVVISNPVLTAKGSIGIQTTVSSSGAVRGIHAEITASGGTGTYTYYFIKIYKDGTLIGSTTNTSSNELFVVGHTNGSYIMEYEVRDSDGTAKTGTSTSLISGF